MSITENLSTNGIIDGKHELMDDLKVVSVFIFLNRFILYAHTYQQILTAHTKGIRLTELEEAFKVGFFSLTTFVNTSFVYLDAIWQKFAVPTDEFSLA